MTRHLPLIALSCLMGCYMFRSHDSYQDEVNKRVAAGQAACKKNPSLAMCHRSATPEASSASTASDSNSSAASGGSFTLVNEHCDGNPVYIVDDASGNRYTGLAAGGSQEITVEAWPATVCLSKDSSSCITNRAKVTASGQTVASQSCSTLNTGTSAE